MKNLDFRVRNLIFYGFIVLLLGGVGGIVMDRLVLPYLSTLPFLRNVAWLNPASPIVITKREEIRINEGINYTETENRVKNFMAAIYVHEKEFGAPGFRMVDRFSGLVVGSDGIILAPAFDRPKGLLVTALLSNRAPLRAAVLATDDFTATTFLKVEARDLPVARQVPSRETRAGERLLAVWLADSPQDARIEPVVQSAEARPEPKIGEYFSFSQLNAFLPIDSGNLALKTRGGVVVNRDSSVVGFATVFGEDFVFLRSDDLKKVMDNFFDDQKILWPNLPISYQIFDAAISEVFGLSKKYGILVQTAVNPLRPGDFIYAVDGRDLTAEEGFQDIVLGKKPGDKIRVKLIRDRQEMEAEINL